MNLKHWKIIAVNAWNFKILICKQLEFWPKNEEIQHINFLKWLRKVKINDESLQIRT